MKRLILAGGLLAMTGAVHADSGHGHYWVVGNRATQRCDIVASNPVIYGLSAYDGSGGYWFGDGPYASIDAAKLARSHIAVCPKDTSENSD